jgi:NAD(P)-dependent dehydrogenase (short-subunit alcohol dehydrogenase family)
MVPHVQGPRTNVNPQSIWEILMQKSDLSRHLVVVAGGTGNVGAFIVEELVASGARVVVPSRSADKAASLRRHLEKKRPDLPFERLHTFTGDLADEGSVGRVLNAIETEAGHPTAAIATLGRFQPIRSLMATPPPRLHQVIDDYLIAHFAVARALLPGLQERGGRYVLVNGPLALQPSKEAALVSIATAGQQMLFKCLAKEFAGSRVSIIELINYAFLRNRQTEPTSTVPGEAVGTYTAYLLSDAAGDLHGETIHLDSMAPLERAGMRPLAAPESSRRTAPK